MLLCLMITTLTGTAAAATDNETASINWTFIGDRIEGAGSIIPSISNLVIAIVPLVLLLIVVGFVTGVFDSIISAIQDAFTFLSKVSWVKRYLYYYFIFNFNCSSRNCKCCKYNF